MNDNEAEKIIEGLKRVAARDPRIQSILKIYPHCSREHNGMRVEASMIMHGNRLCDFHAKRELMGDE